MASTSSELAPGAMALEQAGVAGSSHGCASLCGLNVQGYSRQESESDPEESDEYDEEDFSISDLDTSDPEPEEAAPSVAVAAAAPPTAPVAAAIQIPGPHRSRPRRRRRRTPFQFTEWQVEEMETLFEETQYPDVLTRYACGMHHELPRPSRPLAHGEVLFGSSGPCLPCGPWPSMPLYCLPWEPVWEAALGGISSSVG